MASFEGLFKIFLVIMLATCLIKYGIAHRQMGAQSLSEHYTLTPHIMYPVFIAALFTSIDTIVFVIVLPQSAPKDEKINAFYFFITNVI